MTPKDIRKNMVQAFAADAVSYANVKKRAAEFKRGCGSTEDDPRSGRLKTLTTNEKVDVVNCMDLDDRRPIVQKDS